MSTSDNMQRYFGQDLSDAGVVPIVVVATNHAADVSFILTTDGISLRALGGPVEENATAGLPAAPGRGGEVVAATGGIIGAVGMLVAPLTILVVTPIMMGVGSGMIARSNAVRHNLLAKELRSDTLAPGGEVHGFVYFRLERALHGRRWWRLDIKVTKFPGGRELSFEFPVDCVGGAP